MRRTPGIVILLLLGLAGAAHADEAAGEVKLRNWHVGLQSTGSWRSRFDTFDRAGLPSGAVEAYGRGAGLVVGRRFGGRVLAQLQLTYAQHEIAGSGELLGDVEALATGTVLFGPTRTVQPFLRGGIGGGGQVIQLEDDGGNVMSFGTAAIAGGGAQVRLGSRVSLEFEGVATFTNFLQVNDETKAALWGGGDWQVRVSNWGWRVGAGVVLWF